MLLVTVKRESFVTGNSVHFKASLTFLYFLQRIPPKKRHIYFHDNLVRFW